MEVTTFTNKIQSSNHQIQNISVKAPSIENAKPEENMKFDYDNVMMDLEEVRDFLFMLIGKENPGKIADSKGANLNMLV